jgi:hypothetical protein
MLLSAAGAAAAWRAKSCRLIWPPAFCAPMAPASVFSMTRESAASAASTIKLPWNRSLPMDEALVKQLKQRVETELRQREVDFVAFWLEELTKIDAKRHKELAAFQNDFKNLINRMQNRLKNLRSSLTG